LDTQTFLSAATADADSAVLKIRALAMVPLKISPLPWPALPFQPMNTPGENGMT